MNFLVLCFVGNRYLAVFGFPCSHVLMQLCYFFLFRRLNTDTDWILIQPIQCVIDVSSNTVYLYCGI